MREGGKHLSDIHQVPAKYLHFSHGTPTTNSIREHDTLVKALSSVPELIGPHTEQATEPISNYDL